MTAPLDRPALLAHLSRQDEVCRDLANTHEREGYHDGAIINRAEARAYRVLKYKIEKGQFDRVEASP